MAEERRENDRMVAEREGRESGSYVRDEKITTAEKIQQKTQSLKTKYLITIAIRSS